METRSVVHVEIPAEDVRSAARFYSQIFGWGTQYDEQMDYMMFMYGAEPGSGGGGFNPLGERSSVGDVIVYFGSPSIDADLEAIKAAGGEVVVPKTEIPDMGWFCWFKDPTGNTLGLFETMAPAA